MGWQNVQIQWPIYINVHKWQVMSILADFFLNIKNLNLVSIFNGHWCDSQAVKVEHSGPLVPGGHLI